MELACQIELCPSHGYRMPYIFFFVIAPTIRTRVKRSIAKLLHSDYDYRVIFNFV